MTSDQGKSGDRENTQPPSPPRRSRARRIAARVAHVFSITVSAGLALGLIAGATLTIQHQASARPPVEQRPLLRVETMTARIEPVLVQKDLYAGRIEPRRTSRLAFERAGTIVEVLVDEGASVERNDVIARLDTRSLEARQTELRARRAALEAQAELARLTSVRKNKLQERGFATGQETDDARLGLAQLRASIKEVDAALAAVSIDLEKSVLEAPFAGTVAARDLDEGAIVSAGTAVLDLMETGHPQIRVGLPQDQAQALSAGESYDIVTTDGTVSAHLAMMRPDIDRATRSTIAVFDLPADRPYRFGSTASLVLADRRDRSGAWVPLTALREGTRGLWTIVTVSDGVTGFESVEVLAIDGERAFVRGTLQDGAVIVKKGTHRLVPGTPVAIADRDEG